MKKQEYLKIVLDGLAHHKEFLSEHFYREFKKAEQSHVGYVEFCIHIKEIIESFMHEIERQYIERTTEVNHIIALRKEKGEPVSDLENQKPKMSDFSVLLPPKPNEYTGRLWLHDLEIIYDALLKFIKRIEAEVPMRTKQKKNDVPDSVNYSQRQIAIAFCILGEQITEKNAAKILKTFSQTRSIDKLLQKRIYKASSLTKLSENKTTDTKHLKDLKAAKRLISGKKSKEGVKQITRIITAFETAYNGRY